MRCPWIFPLLCCLATPLRAESSPVRTELVVDAIVASVDGEPITLQDICKKLKPPRKLTLKEASLDSEARQRLDEIIIERLMDEEAKRRHLYVSDAEVDAYVNEIARRNNLTLEGFGQALLSENKDLTSYKQEVRLEIMKSKLASNLVQGGVTISDDEINNYVNAHNTSHGEGNRIRLSQILISTATRSKEEALELARDVRKKAQSDENFAELAQKYSDSPEKSEGGSLGMIAEKELSPFIFDAVLSLEPGEISDVVSSESGFHIFRVDEHLKQGEVDSGAVEEAKKALKQQKLESKLESYFTNEIYQTHSVDKKI